MAYLKVNDTDFSNYVSSLKVGYEVLLSEKSGRNAKGDNTVDIVNRKVKVYVGLRPLNENEMKSFLSAIHPYVVEVSFRNPASGALVSKRCYCSAAEPEFYTIQNGKILYKAMSINFIEM